MDNKNKTLILGGVIGAVTGVAAAMMLHRRAEQNNLDATLSTGESLQLGVLLIGLLRAIASFGDN